MKFSEVFINRPVATMLLALGLFLVGMLAFRILPVAPLPRVDFPTINVSAKLPGADPETMSATVAAPLERRLGEIAGVSELTSTSSTGSANITAQFDLDRDIEGAAKDVQAAINGAGSDLPVDLPTPPTYRKVNPADSPILILAVTSSTLSPGKLYDACDSILAQRISQIEGVAEAMVSGADKTAVRVEADPAALAAAGLSMDDVRNVLSGANANSPKGHITTQKESIAIAANDQIYNAEDYKNLILKNSNGAILKLSNVADITDSVQNSRQAGWFNGGKAIIIIIRKQADANVIETVDRIKEIMPQLESWMPAGTKISVLSDRTQTIRASVEDVEITLLISIILVIMVVWFSLGNATSTLAAGITVPLSLAGTFAAMWGLGYSLNNISLMALTVSVGFVIDDAIVMIENIARHIEKGEKPLQAAIKGAREITFTVISISVSLVAVFIPILFMGGIIGRMFREFAVTLTAAIAVSAIVSITVTPTIYAHLLKLKDRHNPSKFTEMGERFYQKMQNLYEYGLEKIMKHTGMMLLLMLGIIILTIFLYIKIPKGFFPEQDTGMIMGTIEGRTDISFKAIAARAEEVSKIILSDPAIATLGSSVGSGGSNAANQGRLFINLKPVKERKISAEGVINRLRPKLANIPGINVYLQASQDIRVGGRSSKSQYQFAMSSDSLSDLREWTPKLIERLKEEPGLTDISSDQEKATPEIEMVVDRDNIARLGVSMQEIDNALENAFAQRQVSIMYTSRNQYRVILEVAPEYQESPEALKNIYVTAEGGKQIPLSAVARFENGLAPISVNHQGQFPAATLTFNLPPGTSLGDAAAKIKQAADDIHLPENIHTGFAGNAKAFADSLKSQPILIGAALLSIYIILGILYESLRHPVTIISTLPSAGLGALLALLITGFELSLISVIGVILLMGIVKKNGIMLVDFAIAAERHGASPEAAILEACNKRFRPIMMTTFAAILGAMPLIFTGGNGAELRRPLGIAIVGGLLVSQVLTLYTTPVIYLVLDRIGRKRKMQLVEAL